MSPADELRKIESIITDYEHESGYAYFGSLEDRLKFALEPSVALPVAMLVQHGSQTLQRRQH